MAKKLSKKSKHALKTIVIVFLVLVLLAIALIPLYR